MEAARLASECENEAKAAAALQGFHDVAGARQHSQNASNLAQQTYNARQATQQAAAAQQVAAAQQAAAAQQTADAAASQQAYEQQMAAKRAAAAEDQQRQAAAQAALQQQEDAAASEAAATARAHFSEGDVRAEAAAAQAMQDVRMAFRNSKPSAGFSREGFRAATDFTGGNVTPSSHYMSDISSKGSSSGTNAL
ncbi:MAG: hypothetical protein SGARI_002050 [Bacillariaceae sp.]